MGSFANSLFKIMLGWLQAVVSAVWSAFTSENGSSIFNWIGRHWILLAGILCVIGLVTDLCVYIFRWKPYKVWKSFFTGSRNTDFRQPNANPKPTGSQKEKTGDDQLQNRPYVSVKIFRQNPIFPDGKQVMRKIRMMRSFSLKKNRLQ